MNLLFQLTVFAFVGVTFLLIIGVPLSFAQVNSLRSSVNKGIGVWFLLVFAVGILNSFVV